MNQQPHYSAPYHQCNWCSDFTPAYWISADMTKMACSKHILDLYKWEAEQSQSPACPILQNYYYIHNEYSHWLSKVDRWKVAHQIAILGIANGDPLEGVDGLDVCWDGRRMQPCGTGKCGHITRKELAERNWESEREKVR